MSSDTECAHLIVDYDLEEGPYYVGCRLKQICCAGCHHRKVIASGKPESAALRAGWDLGLTTSSAVPF